MLTKLWADLVETRYWRIVAGHPREPSEEIEAKSIHLGDWLRRDYVSLGFEDRQQISMKRFYDEMKIGDKVAVTTDGYLWAIGEIASEVYDKEETGLYRHRRNAVWYRVTRAEVKSFPESLRNKLANPHTVMPLDSNDWNTLVACL